MTQTDDQILDAEWPQRVEGFRFDILDASLTATGNSLLLDASSPASITQDTTQAIMRTLDGVRIQPETVDNLIGLDGIDVIADRIRPVQILGNGSELPLGVFMFADDPRQSHTWGEEANARLVDQGFLLDQPLIESVAYPVGTNLSTILSDQATAAGIPSGNQSIEATPTVTQAPLAWPAGNTHRKAVMDEVALMAGFWPVYFNNDGLLVARTAIDPGAATPDLVYTLDQDGRVDADSVVTSSNLLTAPNVYIVLDTSATSGEIMGRYNIPDAAPHSYANRGFYVPKIINTQGLQDVAAANVAAQAAYLSDKDAPLTFVSFTAPPDARHDTFQVLEVDLVNYLETNWSLGTHAGGTHSHDAWRSWTA